MDTLEPQDIPQTRAVPMRTIISISIGVIAIALVAIFGWWYMSQKSAQEETQSSADLNSSLEAITATTSISVPSTADPLKSATPVVNPTEKTNPFNNDYQNPFQ